MASIAEREERVAAGLVLSALLVPLTGLLVGSMLRSVCWQWFFLFPFPPSLSLSVRHVESFFRVPPSSYWRRAVRVGTNAWSPFLARVDRVVFRGRVERGRVVFRVFLHARLG